MNGTWVYKIKNIDSIYQSMIVKYIAKGYKVITSHSSGSQSEQHKIDFTDGKNIYRIWYVEDSETIRDTNNNYYYGRLNYILLSVRKYEINENSLYLPYHNTLWFDKGEIVEEKKFYLVNEYDKHGRINNDKRVYFDNKEYAIAEIRKSESRWTDNITRNKIALSKESKKRIVEMIKVKGYRGFSNLRIKDIDYLMHIIEHGNSKYIVYFSKEYNKTYKMQLKVRAI